MDRKTRNILVVEKDPILSDLLEYWIGSERHVVLSASDESSGYHKASAGPLDLIIVDVDSLGNKGIGLIGDLRTVQPKASIFAIVPSGKQDVSVRAFQEGADISMEKPIKVDDIKEYLSKGTKYVN